MTSRVWAVVLALLVGGTGGLLFSHWQLPLPWMLGSMSACLLGALVGLPLAETPWVPPYMRAILGFMLGSTFTPALLASLGGMALSLVCLIPYIIIISLLGIPYFRRMAGVSGATAYFAAMPGGLQDMVLIGRDMGGDDRIIALVHGTRVLLIVFVLPFLVELAGAGDLGSRAAFGKSLAQVAWLDVATLVACCLVGWPLAVALRLPGPSIVGPMLVSVAIHISGWSQAQAPSELISIAQLIIGIAIGCRFVGIAPREVARVILLSLGLLLIMAATTGMFALILSRLLGINPVVIVLAFSPGGLAETSLIALSLNMDVAFVATHHLCRILMVVIGAPLAFRGLRRVGG